MHHAFAARVGRALLTAALGVACLAGTASVAAADDSSLVEFTVPDHAAIEKLQRLGYDLTEYTRPVGDGRIYINAEVTPSEQSELEAMGYPAGQVIESPQTRAAVRAHADASWREQADAFKNLHAGHTVAGARSAAAADTVLASRADYFENYAGRYISIEARTSANSPVPGDNPVMTAAWDSGPGTAVGGTGREGTLTPFIDGDPPDADYYLYHFNTFRVGSLGDGPMPAMVRVASAKGGVDTIAVKRWTSQNGKGFPAGYAQDFNVDYTDPQKAYAKIRDLAAEFPNLAQIYDLPFKTAGYQRNAQTIAGLKTPYAGEVSNRDIPGVNGKPDESSAIRQTQAVILTSKASGQDGGNDITAQLKDPGAPDAPLSVSVAGSAITVDLATNSAGAITSTAAQVVDAINASPEVSALVTATRYRTDTGAGVVFPNATPLRLSDYLHAPPSYPRGRQTVQMIRIGTHRDGTKTGVLLYCEEHAREWATSLTCLETAERLLRNYATDAETKDILDNLDIFIIPVVNADGMAYSRYDNTGQRRNLTNYCAAGVGDPNAPGFGTSDPVARNRWGVDINRNFSVGSFYDGFVGATNDCTNDVFAGPSEFSEPESQNERWVQRTFANIRFANNVHSYGGYFMWPPGAYKTVGRETLPYASFGTNQFFDQTAATTLERVQSYRKTTVLPARTGPVADVLYSAAGNSADEAFYNHSIIGYDFEIGVDRFVTDRGCTDPADIVDMNSRDCVAPVGFTPPYAPEGHDEAMEFASGNIGLLTAAAAYEKDHTPPTVKAVLTKTASGLDLTFDQSEPADIYYTTDGSTPTTSSPHYQPAGPRQRVQPVHLPGPVTLKYMAVDIKGQSSGVQTQVWSTDANGGVSGSVPATLSFSLNGPPAAFGAFTPGVDKDYLATTGATVTSTAGDALLSVADPSSDHTGYLVNGSLALPSPLQARATKSDTTGTAPNNVGSSAGPLNLLTWSAPVSNDAVNIEFKQHISRTDPLRTGTYAKTLTFTLSTTNP